MDIQGVGPRQKGGNNVILINNEGGHQNKVVIGAYDVSEKDEKPLKPDKKTETDFGKLLANGAALKATWEGGQYVLNGVQNASAPQISGLLQKTGQFSNTAAADAAATQVKDFIQTKGASAVGIGALAGTLGVVVIDLIRPAWSIERKLVGGVLIAAIVAAIVYFGIGSLDEPQPETANEEVTNAVEVEPQDPSLESSPIVNIEPEAPILAKRSRKSCMWNGKEFSDGGVVCESRRSYKCWDGRWMSGGFC